MENIMGVMNEHKGIRLSIIVPVYNVEKYLARCINSLYSQGLDENRFEVILINDGSTDGSLKVANAFKNERSNLSVYSQENQGQSAARNTGLRYATGDCVIFVDSDDWLLPYTMVKVLEISTIGDLDVCGYRFKELCEDGKSKMGAVHPFNPDLIIKGEDALLGGANLGSVCANMYRREFLMENHLLFSVGMTHEDVDFNARVYAYAKRMRFTDIVGYVYYYNVDSLNRSHDTGKVRKRLFDNVVVAKNMYTFSKSLFLSDKLKVFYVRHANSIVVSDILSLIRCKRIRPWLGAYLSFVSQQGLYPMKGKTLSWKTSLLIPVINQQWLFNFIKKFL